MLEIGIVGAKNSGKTTVIEGLIKYLVGRGIKVATIKHTSHMHKFDTPGKDTYRHRDAGATITIAAGAEEVAVFAEPDSLSIKKLQGIAGNGIDVWLVEGDRNADRAKILVTRKMSEMESMPSNIIASIGPEIAEGVNDYFNTNDYSGLGRFIEGLITQAESEGKA